MSLQDILTNRKKFKFPNFKRKKLKQTIICRFIIIIYI